MSSAVRRRTSAEIDDRERVPRVVQYSLFWILVLCGVISAGFIGRFPPLPMTELLDAWLFAFIVLCAVRGRIRTPILLAVLALYGVTRAVGVISTEAPLVDALQAYKWMLYLVVFAIVLGRRWTAVHLLPRLAWILIILATMKAGLTLILLGPEERPGLFLENNFELALFSGLAAVSYDHLGRHRILLIGVLGVLTVLAGSRSGSIAFVLLVIYVLVRSRLVDRFLKYLAYGSIAAAAIIPLMIFRIRAAESRVVDRVRFLDLFRDEVADFSWLEWLWGTTPITTLSDRTCRELAFYETLLASTGDGTCYSVILHAFAMRIVYDAGIVGLLMVFVIPFALMVRAGVPMSLNLTLMAIAGANALSVSGLNNPYVALPIALAICCAAMPAPAGAEQGAGEGSGDIASDDPVPDEARPATAGSPGGSDPRAPEEQPEPRDSRSRSSRARLGGGPHDRAGGR